VGIVSSKNRELYAHINSTFAKIITIVRILLLTYIGFALSKGAEVVKPAALFFHKQDLQSHAQENQLVSFTG
jgi:hypothetical protein